MINLTPVLLDKLSLQRGWWRTSALTFKKKKADREMNQFQLQFYPENVSVP